MPLVAAAAVSLVGAVFACADAALTSLSAARLGALAQEAGARTRPALLRAVDQRDALQARYVIGRVLCTCTGAACFAFWLLSRGLSAGHTVAAAAGALVAAAIAFEVVTAVGRKAADVVVPVTVYVLRPLEILLLPLGAAAGLLSRLATRRWERQPQDPRVAETEVELMVEQQERSGLLEQDGAEMIRNVLELSDLTARDVMVPRTKVVALRVDTSPAQVRELIVAQGHSRYPVYRDDIDSVFGLIYAKDLFTLAEPWRSPSAGPEAGAPPAPEPSLEGIAHPVKFVSEHQPLHVLLRQMRQNREHLAVVVDEFGGMSGIVTLEDILEEIVGDIQDEFDHERAPIVEEDGRLLVDAAVLVSDLSDYLGADLDPEDKHGSLGGLLIDKLGRVPEVDTTVDAFGLQLVVRQADEKHIILVEIIRGSERSAEPTSPPAQPASCR